MPVLLAAQRLAAARVGDRPDGGDGDDHSPRRRRCSSSALGFAASGQLPDEARNCEAKSGPWCRNREVSRRRGRVRDIDVAVTGLMSDLRATTAPRGPDLALVYDLLLTVRVRPHSLVLLMSAVVL